MTSSSSFTDTKSMNLQEAFHLDRNACVAFVGAGGKTTAMFRLAHDLKMKFGTTVIVTTTTHLASSQASLADRHFFVASHTEEISCIENSPPSIILVTGPAEGEAGEKRLSRIPEKLLDWLREFCGYHNLPLLIEADGAKRKPLKAPAAHEPSIPSFVDLVVVCAGLTGIGNKMNDKFIHRVDIYTKISRSRRGDIVSAEAVAQNLKSSEGGMKDIPVHSRRIALLNQVDTARLQSIGQTIATKILDAYDAVVLTSFNISARLDSTQRTIQGIAKPKIEVHSPNTETITGANNLLSDNDQVDLTSFNISPSSERDSMRDIHRLSFGHSRVGKVHKGGGLPDEDGSASLSIGLTSFNISSDQTPISGSHLSVFAVHQRVAGIVLAAGGSSRFGKPKQLLEYQGQPFVCVVAETALQAGLSPIIIVTGALHNQVARLFDGTQFRLAYNHEWESGQSTSIRAGLNSLSEYIGAAVFLLADQPQISQSVICALKERHALTHSPIIAPIVLEDRRGNPVLFDRSTFPDLLGLEGDTGGRGIFGKHRVDYLPWLDSGILLDIDTPDDYKKLFQ